MALVSKWSISYSGGGRQVEYADFIMLNDDGTYQVAFKNILFSAKELIRACFNNEDYKKDTHCHDESWSTLNVKIKDVGKGYYAWELTTKSYFWPAWKNKQSTRVSISKKTIYPFQSPHGN